MSLQWNVGRRLALTIGMATMMAATCFADQAALIKSVGDALTEGNATKSQLAATMASLNTLLASKPGEDMRPAYQAYVENVAKTKSDAGVTKARVDQMNGESANYFSTWKSDNETISNADLKKVATKRLNTVQKDYKSSLASLQMASGHFAPFLSDLTDIQTALSNDLTPNGLKAAKGVFKKANKDHAAVQKEIDKAITHLRATQTSLLPVAQAK
jgi:hypothetical protein